MAILAALKKENPQGPWSSLGDYLRDLRMRETGAIAALNATFSASSSEQKELAEGEGATILLEVARDLRVPKGSRLAATRCALEAALSPPVLGQLYCGAGDLVTDPRLGAAGKRLAEAGLAAALQAPGKEKAISFEAASFARGVQASASLLTKERVQELLAKAPKAHAGASAGAFAAGIAPLPDGERAQWKSFLTEVCLANRRAPAAAKRMGLAPPWPPSVPDAFGPLLVEVEKAAADVPAAKDAAAMTPRTAPAPGKAPPAPPPPSAAPTRKAGLGAPLPAGSQLPKAPPAPEPGQKPAPQRPAPAGEFARGSASEAPPPDVGLVAPGKQSSSQVIGTRRIEKPIKRSPFRKSIGQVQEGPITTAPKTMPPVASRALPEAQKTAAKDAGTSEGGAKVFIAPLLPGLQALPSAKPSPKLDARGRRLPRADRWRDDAFEWEEPVLPTSQLRPPMRVAAAQGPFAQRLASLLDDRPEAVDRLCAAAEARAALTTIERVETELRAEVSLPRWKDRRAPQAQLDRLAAIAKDEHQPAEWRKAAATLLAALPRDG